MSSRDPCFLIMTLVLVAGCNYTPTRFNDDEGRPIPGLWKGEIEQVDLSEARGPGSEKAWQYVGLYSERAVVGLAVVDLDYVGTAFCYVYDRETGDLWEFGARDLFACDERVDRNVAAGRSEWSDGDDHHLRIENDIHSGTRTISARLLVKHEKRDQHEALTLEVVLGDDQRVPEPLQTLTPSSEPERFSFTHKSAGLAVRSAKLTVGPKTISLADARGALDFTFGFPAAHTVWEWVSLAGDATAPDGTKVAVGLNLVEPVYHQEFNENGLWIDGKLVKTGDATVMQDLARPDDPWRITTADGKVDLTFQPLGRREEDIDFNVLGIHRSSRYQQPFGTFSGTIQDAGRHLTLTGVCGVVEYHEARW